MRNFVHVPQGKRLFFILKFVVALTCFLGKQRFAPDLRSAMYSTWFLYFAGGAFREAISWAEICVVHRPIHRGDWGLEGDQVEYPICCEGWFSYRCKAIECYAQGLAHSRSPYL